MKCEHVSRVDELMYKLFNHCFVGREVSSSDSFSSFYNYQMESQHRIFTVAKILILAIFIKVSITVQVAMRTIGLDPHVIDRIVDPFLCCLSILTSRLFLQKPLNLAGVLSCPYQDDKALFQPIL